MKFTHDFGQYFNSTDPSDKYKNAYNTGRNWINILCFMHNKCWGSCVYIDAGCLQAFILHGFIIRDKLQSNDKGTAFFRFIKYKQTSASSFLYNARDPGLRAQ
jgi:hypothetical protein